MVAHLVLYRPKPGLDAEARDRFTEAIVLARREIPAIRRFVVGRRIVDGPSYKLGPFPDFPYIAVIEFDDRAGLLTYLQHPHRTPAWGRPSAPPWTRPSSTTTRRPTRRVPTGSLLD